MEKRGRGGRGGAASCRPLSSSPNPRVPPPCSDTVRMLMFADFQKQRPSFPQDVKHPGSGMEVPYPQTTTPRCEPVHFSPKSDKCGLPGFSAMVARFEEVPRGLPCA